MKTDEIWREKSRKFDTAKAQLERQYVSGDGILASVIFDAMDFWEGSL